MRNCCAAGGRRGRLLGVVLPDESCGVTAILSELDPATTVSLTVWLKGGPVSFGDESRVATIAGKSATADSLRCVGALPPTEESTLDAMQQV